MMTPAHLEALEARGLDPEMLARHGVESFARLGVDWISIPFVKQGRVVNHKYRTIRGQKEFRQDKDAEKVFWNVDVISDQTLAKYPLIITEGEFDAMIALQCGKPRVVSVPDGAPPATITDPASRKYEFIHTAPGELGQVPEIILCTDGDQPGINLMNDLAIRLGKSRCKFVQYPEGCKDLNDVFKVHGAAGVQRVIDGAQWMDVPGLYSMDELPPIARQPVYRLGYGELDNHYRMRPQDLTIITGIPSHGKSSFITDVACRMAKQFGWPACFASFEQQPQTDHRRALRTWFTGKKEKNQTQDELLRADRWINDMFSFIVPSNEDYATLDWVMDRASAAVIRHGAKLIIIDPWNELDHTRPSDQTLTEYTGFAIKEFKRFARKHQVHVIVAAHPAKMLPDKDGTIRMPSLYDISDSAHWANKADAGLVIWRGTDKMGNQISKVKIAKVRYQEEIGIPGEVEVRFNPDTAHYECISTDENRPVMDQRWQ